jgi:hypothetical protein
MLSLRRRRCISQPHPSPLAPARPAGHTRGMDPEREDYADLDRQPKRRIFSPIQIVIFAIAIACGLIPVGIEAFKRLWGRWGP